MTSKRGLQRTSYKPIAQRLERIEEALRSKPLTVLQIAAAAICSRRATYYYLTHLRQQKKVRIASWVQEGTKQVKWVACYGLGSAPDKPKPKPRPGKEKAQLYRQKLHDTGQHDIFLARRRARDAEKRMLKLAKQAQGQSAISQLVQLTNKKRAS